MPDKGDFIFTGKFRRGPLFTTILEARAKILEKRENHNASLAVISAARYFFLNLVTSRVKTRATATRAEAASVSTTTV